MKYANKADVNLRDQVVGRDPAGRPIAGEVLEVDREKGKVLVSPALHTAVWADAGSCVPASVFEEAKTEAAPAAPAANEPTGV